MLACTDVEGVSFEDDDEMEVELSLSVEEQLQYSLDSLRDAVIKRVTDAQPSTAAEACMSHIHTGFTIVSLAVYCSLPLCIQHSVMD